MSYGYQSDPAQDYSQHSPFRRKAQKNPLQDAIGEGNTWGSAANQLNPGGAAGIAAQSRLPTSGLQGWNSPAATKVKKSLPGVTPEPTSRPITQQGLESGMSTSPGMTGGAADSAGDRLDEGRSVEAQLEPADETLPTPTNRPPARQQPRTAAARAAADFGMSEGDLEEQTNAASYPYDRNAINDAYKQHLGRDAGDADFEAHRGNVYGMEGILDAVQSSPEAAAYAKRIADGSIKDDGSGAVPKDDAPAPGSGLEGVDTSQWDTDNWAMPEYITKTPGGVMAGWDQTNWNDPNMQTPKYVVGRIFSQYDPNDPAQLSAAMAELQKAYPGATFDGKDKISIPGLGTIDAIINAGAPGATWGWQDLTNDPQGGGGAGGGGGADASWFSKNQQMGGDAASFISQFLPQLLKDLNLNAAPKA